METNINTTIMSQNLPLPEAEEQAVSQPVSIDVERALRLLEVAEQNLRDLRQIIGSPALSGAAQASPAAHYSVYDTEDEGIEGVFDGERMVDAQGKTYQVSPNYASKSKLIEGDPLKLYIAADGKYFYKQLGPLPRTNVVGTLRAEGNRFVVDAENGLTYNVLTASATYYMSMFNVRVGDKLLLMVPADQPARWAVIDNVA